MNTPTPSAAAPSHSPAPLAYLAPVAGKRIIIGIAGGIATYKMATVVSRLAQAGAEVSVLMTESATRFVTPLTFQALSGRPVFVSPWEHLTSSDPQHITLARNADLALIGPATMDLCAKLAHGQTDDIVCLVLSAIDRAKTPVIIAPSMNEVMWQQPANTRNIAQLKADGFHVIDPASGWQACRTVGVGRLPEAEELLAMVVEVVGKRAR